MNLKDVISRNGESRTLSDWARTAGLNPVTVWARVRAGWDVERALTTPANTRFHGKGERQRHGMTESHKSEYYLWTNIKNRCENPNNPRYSSYGGRGIVLSERWQSFANFVSDMGPRPSDKHSVDRIDNDGPYSPENCCWATNTSQQRNKRNNRVLTWNGESKTAAEWAENLGMRSHLILSRIDRYGWTVEQALSTPARKMDGPKLKSHKPNPLNNS